jgi:hypothetical protein
VVAEEQWITVVGGTASPEDAETILRDGAAAFGSVLDERPDATRIVDEILDARLKDPDPETWSTISSSVTRYLGVDASYLLTWLIQDLPNRPTELERFAPHAVASFFNQVLAMHGPELDSTFARWRENPNDWRTMFREVLFDQVTGRWRINLRVYKYNGEEILLEGPRDAFLNMTRNLLVTLQWVGADSFSSLSVSSFVEEAQRFLASLARAEEASEETAAGLPGGSEPAAAIPPAPSSSEPGTP